MARHDDSTHCSSRARVRCVRMLAFSVVLAFLGACAGTPRHRYPGARAAARPNSTYEVRPLVIEVEDGSTAVLRAAQVAMAQGMNVAEVSKENGLLRVGARFLDLLGTRYVRAELAERIENLRAAAALGRLAGNAPESAELAERAQLEESYRYAEVSRVLSITAIAGGGTATVTASIALCTRLGPGIGDQECETPITVLQEREYMAFQAIVLALGNPKPNEAHPPQRPAAQQGEAHH